MIDIIRTTYRKLAPYVKVGSYVGTPGHEANGTAVPWHVLDSLALTGARGWPDEYLATGVDERSDGVWFLRFAVSRLFLETVTDYRDLDVDSKRLVYVCPDCQGHSDKHTKACRG
jgi:hypothetical protein